MVIFLLILIVAFLFAIGKAVGANQATPKERENLSELRRYAEIDAARNRVLDAEKRNAELDANARLHNPAHGKSDWS